MKRVAITCLATGLTLGAALIVSAELHSRKVRERSQIELQSRANRLGGAFKAVAEKVQTRASELAVLPVFRSAVATDPATVGELAAHDVAFAHGADEAIELFQIPREGPPILLVRVGSLRSAPPPSPSLPKMEGGRKLSFSFTGQGLSVTAVHRIEPMYRKDELDGAVAFTKALDLGPLTEEFRSGGVAAALRSASNRIALYGNLDGQPTLESSVPLAAGLDPADLVLLAQLPSGWETYLRVAGAILAALGLASALALTAVGRRNRLPSSTERGEGLGTAFGPTRLTPTGPKSEALPTEGPPQLAAGDLVSGKYRIIRRVGSGGLAEVYLAQAIGEASFQRRVALKILRPEVSHPMALEHFLDEARLAAQLSHPNIAHIYDLGRTKDRYFIAMEYVEGADVEVLLEKLRNRGSFLPPMVALSIGIQMCEGLYAAHTATDSEGKALRIIHRDVKPSNVLIAKSGSVKVADFGIAKANERSRGTELGMIKGTLDYMAPEQRLGGAVDERTDVYGAGAVLYELFTSRRISLDLSRLVQLDRMGWPHLPPPSQVGNGVPAQADEIVFRALKFEPAHRYASCRELAKALERLLVGIGGTASTATVAQWLAESEAVDGSTSSS